jgi:prepilin-type N-terminal cleavage/methylation domain-containing protein
VKRIGDIAAGLRRSQQGFTLIELLVATSIGMVVLGGAVTVFIGAVRSEPRTSAKVTAIQQGRVATERITRELRQGFDVLDVPDAPTPTAHRLSLLTYVKQSTCGGSPAAASIPCRVTYTCEAGACSRVVAQPNGSSPGAKTQVVSGLATPNVFTYVPSATNPSYIGVELAFTTQEGAGPVVVADGASLRGVDSS